MFEDTTTCDFFDDSLETTFKNPVSRQYGKSIEYNNKICERGDKRRSETDPEKENLKISKLNDFKTSPVYSYTQIVAKSPNKIMKRKFPGPAGLLPDNCDSVNKSIQDFFQDDQKSNDSEIFLCSQKTFSVFERGPWQKMEVDFQDSEQDLLFEKFNILWIKSNFSVKKQPVKNKVPFLAAVIDSLEITEGKYPTVNVILKDKTGTIQGSILHSLYEEYSDYFTVGSVLVLTQFGVLSEQNNHCLTIISNNLLAIYHLNVNKTSEYKDSKSSKEGVEKLVLQQYLVGDIWRKYKESISPPQKKSINFKNLYKSSVDRNWQSPKVTNSNSHLIDSGLCNTSTLSPNKEISTKCYDKTNYPYEKNNQVQQLISRKPENIQNSCISKSSHAQMDNNNVNLSISSCQIKTDKAHLQIWEDLFQEVDTDALFDDF